MASAPRTKWSNDEKIALLVAMLKHHPIPPFSQIALPEGRNANACSKMFNNILKEIESVTMVQPKGVKVAAQAPKSTKAAKGPTKAELKRDAAALKDVGDMADDESDSGPVKKKVATAAQRKVNKQANKEESEESDKPAPKLTKVAAAQALASLHIDVPTTGTEGKAKSSHEEGSIKAEGEYIDPDETEWEIDSQDRFLTQSDEEAFQENQRLEALRGPIYP
ncbi:MAG: hypothetical protein M1829_002653 [Trizodia sp. TS-e1964]|nr:MAG: hypothetical protein M1829_002653 [Trizodia sp. TS-e1964]